MSHSLIQTRRCFHCGQDGTLLLPDEGIAKYESGAFVQDAFPELARELREQIISGTHPKCWEEMFAPFGDDEDEDEED